MFTRKIVSPRPPLSTPTFLLLPPQRFSTHCFYRSRVNNKFIHYGTFNLYDCILKHFIKEYCHHLTWDTLRMYLCILPFKLLIFWCRIKQNKKRRNLQEIIRNIDLGKNCINKLLVRLCCSIIPYSI